MSTRVVTKIILKKNKGLEVHHHGERDKIGTLSAIKETVFAEPGSSFHKSFANLRVFLVKSTGSGFYEAAFELDSIAKHITPEEKKDVMQGLNRYAAKQVAIKQVHITYEETEIMGVKLYGTYNNQYGDVMQVVSPQMNLIAGNYPFGARLLAEIENVIEEAKSYVFKNKYTQLIEEEEVDLEEEAPEVKGEEEEEEAPISRLKRA